MADVFLSLDAELQGRRAQLVDPTLTLATWAMLSRVSPGGGLISFSGHGSPRTQSNMAHSSVALTNLP